ncbi:uncharacterized protein I206_105802 [Kwoniella pini CBS 10737]|uniref:Alpha/beta hydrolase fold-3 domain-containing protein n=1 Tax=Kwoniella pini CBS 10737 TaxID=1296096 RepID=A0A1B9I093_9TREE|nr:uncharacterized protein I206_04622 [Kwoniella pini CBS 10737]OCF48935.1 hypothetical protein I206_04622 [Kwoniella pini CBS 10737]
MNRYVRSKPDLSAPNAPSQINYRIITNLTHLMYLIILPFYLIYLTLYHIITPKPFSSWTIDRRISINLSKLQQYLSGWWIPPPPIEWEDWKISIPGESYIKSKERGEIDLKVVKFEPVKPDYIKGIIDVQNIKTIPRPGFLISPIGSKGKLDDISKIDEKVILHIHGGGYIRGHPLWTTFPLEISRSTKLRCLSVNYRKTLSEDTAFPAPILDVLSAYLYLVQNLKFKSENIILLGESAGAHLALFLSQYLKDLYLSQPGYLFLSSPWSDFTLTYAIEQEHKAYCHSTTFRLSRAIRSATRYYNLDFLNTGYASPAKMSKGGWDYLRKEKVKVYMHYGGRELFHDEIVALGEGMKRDGVDVMMRLDPDGLHTSGISGDAGEVFKKDILEILS